MRLDPNFSPTIDPVGRDRTRFLDDVVDLDMSFFVLVDPVEGPLDDARSAQVEVLALLALLRPRRHDAQCRLHHPTSHVERLAGRHAAERTVCCQSVVSQHII